MMIKFKLIHCHKKILKLKRNLAPKVKNRLTWLHSNINNIRKDKKHKETINKTIYQ
jgi:hypothetical protein